METKTPTITKNTFFNTNIATLISLVVFSVSTYGYFSNVKSNMENRMLAIEYNIKNVETEISTKADLVDMEIIKVKLANIEWILLELKNK